MSLEHYRAVAGLLSGLPMTFYPDGQVPDTPTFPYAVLFMDTGDEERTKLAGGTDQGEYRFQVTSVGIAAESARIVADAARNLVLDVRPVVAGYSCTRIGKETTQQIRPDRDVTLPNSNRHPMYAVEGFVFESRPA